MGIRDLISPFTAWKYAFRDPVTIRDPLNDRPGATRYRGFHQNDVERCIGCGTCEAICQNGAIDMLPVEGIETKPGDSGLRPRIDYGRCCWCALCVDVCMTSCLTMSNEYKWSDSDGDAFRFTPGVDAKPWDDAELGYRRPAGHRLTSPERVEMGELAPEDRRDWQLALSDRDRSPEHVAQDKDQPAEELKLPEPALYEPGTRHFSLVEIGPAHEPPAKVVRLEANGDVLAFLAEARGWRCLVGINFHVGFLRADGKRDVDTPLAEIRRHATYIADRIGIDHVAFGSDFDGAMIPAPLGDVTGLPALLEEFRSHGYDDASLRKIAYENWVRVLNATWK